MGVSVSARSPASTSRELQSESGELLFIFWFRFQK